MVYVKGYQVVVECENINYCTMFCYQIVKGPQLTTRPCVCLIMYYERTFKLSGVDHFFGM